MKEIYQAFPFGDNGPWMVQKGTAPYVALFTDPAEDKSPEQRAREYAEVLNDPNYVGPSGPPDGPP